MPHLDEGTLHALLDGELDVAEVKEIQTHLGACAACGSRLQDVKQFLAHKIRNLLTTTLGYASYLEDETEGLLTEDQRSYLRRIGTSVDLMINLVNELVEQSEQPPTTVTTEIGLRT